MRSCVGREAGGQLKGVDGENGCDRNIFYEKTNLKNEFTNWN